MDTLIHIVLCLIVVYGTSCINVSSWKKIQLESNKEQRDHTRSSIVQCVIQKQSECRVVMVGAYSCTCLDELRLILETAIGHGHNRSLQAFQIDAIKVYLAEQVFIQQIQEGTEFKLEGLEDRMLKPVKFYNFIILKLKQHLRQVSKLLSSASKTSDLPQFMNRVPTRSPPNPQKERRNSRHHFVPGTTENPKKDIPNSGHHFLPNKNGRTSTAKAVVTPSPREPNCVAGKCCKCGKRVKKICQQSTPPQLYIRKKKDIYIYSEKRKKFIKMGLNLRLPSYYDYSDDQPVKILTSHCAAIYPQGHRIAIVCLDGHGKAYSKKESQVIEEATFDTKLRKIVYSMPTIKNTMVYKSVDLDGSNERIIADLTYAYEFNGIDAASSVLYFTNKKNHNTIYSCQQGVKKCVLQKMAEQSEAAKPGGNGFAWCHYSEDSVSFYTKGFTKTVNVPFSFYCTDLCYFKQKWFIFSKKKIIRIYSATGDFLESLITKIQLKGFMCLVG